MEKFKMPTEMEIRAQHEKGLRMNSARITLKGLEIISEQLDELNRKIDRLLKVKKKDVAL